MSSSLVPVLHHEERSIVAELRASKPFQRLEAIRKLLALYDVQPSVAAGLDMPLGTEADRAGGEVVHLAPAVAAPAAALYTPSPAAAPAAPVASAIPLPGPSAAPVTAMAEAVDAGMRGPSMVGRAESDSSSVVSSVRAALLGIGKN